jgi:hypothetical protein
LGIDRLSWNEAIAGRGDLNGGGHRSSHQHLAEAMDSVHFLGFICRAVIVSGKAIQEPNALYEKLTDHTLFVVDRRLAQFISNNDSIVLGLVQYLTASPTQKSVQAAKPLGGGKSATLKASKSMVDGTKVRAMLPSALAATLPIVPFVQQRSFCGLLAIMAVASVSRMEPFRPLPWPILRAELRRSERDLRQTFVLCEMTRQGLPVRR